MVSTFPTQLLRIKRKRNQDPLDAFVVAPLEKKLCKEIAQQVSEIEDPKFFKLVETTENPNLKNLDKYSVLTNEKLAQRRDSLALNKTLENKAARYKIVNFNRNLDTDKNVVSVMDIAREEDAIPLRLESKKDLNQLLPMFENLLKEENDTPQEYVYDIYVRDDGLVPMDKMNMGELIWESEQQIFLPDQDDSESDYDDEFDSNAESCEWNDYPDEESELSVQSYEQEYDSDVDEYDRW